MSDPFERAPSALTAPIAGSASPAGEDPKYGDAYAAARREVDKLTALTGGPVDWTQVEQSCAEVLRSQGKDLRMAAYWVAAAYERRSLDGLHTGLALSGALCQRYGEALHPGRARARAGALEWLVEYLSTRLANHRARHEEAEALDRLEALVPVVASQVDALLGDDGPSLRPLLDALARVRQALPAEPSDSPQATPEPHAPEAGEAQGTSPSDPIGETLRATDAARAASTDASIGERDDPGADLRAAAEAWLAPISEQAPAGSDARYDPRYEALRAEAAKLDSPSGGAPDWKLVRAHADALLREQTKDLVVATHLCQALWSEGDWGEVVKGLWLITGLWERFAAELYPARARARANAMALLVSKLQLCVAELNAEHLSLAQIAAVSTAMDAMFERVRAGDPEAAPSARDVGAALRSLELTVQEREAAEKPKPADPAAGPRAKTEAEVAPALPARPATPANQAATAKADLPEVATAPTDLTDVRRYLRTTGARLAQVGNMATEAEAGAALGYRLRRLAAWLPLVCTPEAQWSTARPPKPDAQMRRRLEMLHEGGQWQALAQEAERALALAPLWLDLQRFSADALHALGPDTQEAAEAVAREARGLVARIPALLDLCFSDDTPAASPATRTWLSAEANHGGAGGAGASTTHGGAATPALPADLVARLSASGAEALSDAQRLIEGQRSEGARFRMRLELARACRAAKLTAVAEGLLAALDRAIEDHGLAKWDPELTSETLVEYLNLLESRGGTPGEDHPQLVTMRARLAHLAPASLARLATKKGR